MHPLFCAPNVYPLFISLFLKFKNSIRTFQRVLHIKMFLETKFYIFWKFFTIFSEFFIKLNNNKKKKFSKVMTFKNYEKIVKNFQKL